MLTVLILVVGGLTAVGIYYHAKGGTSSDTPSGTSGGGTGDGAGAGTSAPVDEPAATDTRTPTPIPPTSSLTAYTPTEEKIKAFAEAIAFAEGFGKVGAIPTRSHNPGDLRPPNGEIHYWSGQTGIDAGHAVFMDDNAGWLALYRQVRLMAEDRSNFYDLTMPITQVGKIYAESDTFANGVGPWAKNVSARLGIKPETMLGEYFYGKV